MKLMQQALEVWAGCGSRAKHVCKAVPAKEMEFWLLCAQKAGV